MGSAYILVQFLNAISAYILKWMEFFFFFWHLCDYFSSFSLTLLFSSEDYSSCTVSSTSNHRFWLELACVLFHADVEVGVSLPCKKNLTLPTNLDVCVSSFIVRNGFFLDGVVRA